MRSTSLCCFLAAAACAQAPGKEVELAAARVEKARQAGADQYAVELLREAEAALADARRLLGREEDYLAAVKAAAFASVRADEARAIAAAERRKPQSEAARLLTEIGALIEQAVSLGAAAQELEGFRPRFHSAQATLRSGRPEEAVALAQRLKADLLALHRRLKGG